MKFSLIFSVVLTAALVVAACSHGIKRVEYPLSTSPVEVMQTFTVDLEDGRARQVDVLAAEDFERAENVYKKAEREVRAQSSQRRILKTLGEARAYLTRANELAEGRRAQVEGILKARQAALNAGVIQFKRLNDDWDKANSELSDVAQQHFIKPDEFSDMQKKFMNLETRAIQSTHLRVAREKVEGALQKKAGDLAPRVLNRAEIALKYAGNMIAANSHNESAFRQSVADANYRADFLVDVMSKVSSAGTVIPEAVAIRLVTNERELNRLRDRLDTTAAVKERQSETISLQEQELLQARSTISIDRALAKARELFAEDEADVYRDGDKLLLRLRTIQFKSGSSDLPPGALPLLGRVRVVTEELNPLQVLVEGHTDATGSVRTNNILSQRRAEAIAEYLVTAGLARDKIQAIGFGSSKPIGDNRSREGRALNRRVDVIVTPAAVDTATTSM